jgi:hypothetical protein
MKTKNYHIVGIVPEFKENPWKESPTIFLAQIHHARLLGLAKALQ